MMNPMMMNDDTPMQSTEANLRRVDTGIIHGSFTLARQIAASPETVFSAYSDLSMRRRWFRIPGQGGSEQHELDFRVGGGEIMSGTFAAAGVPEHIEYRPHFFDIVAARRIIFACELALDGRRRSVSLVTIELAPAVAGTQLTYSEQYTFVAVTGDGHDDIAEREGGMRLQLNALASAVERGESPGEPGHPGV